MFLSQIVRQITATKAAVMGMEGFLFICATEQSLCVCVCECVCEHPRVLPATIIKLRNPINEKQHELNKGMAICVCASAQEYLLQLSSNIHPF